MEKTKLIKIFLVIMVTLALAFNTTKVFADDAISFTDLDSQNTAKNENTNSGTVDTDTNTNTNTNRNTNTGGNTNSNTNTGGNSSLSTTNSSNSSYNTNVNKVTTNTNNNSNLPKTGLADNSAVVCLTFALAVSAIYAFKKYKEYNA